MDPYQYAMYRLYRDATRYVDGKYVKDLSHLNRDLSKVIIMDSNPQSFSLQPENGIPLKPWNGELKNNGLLEYIPFLEGKKNNKLTLSNYYISNCPDKSRRCSTYYEKL